MKRGIKTYIYSSFREDFDGHSYSPRYIGCEYDYGRGRDKGRLFSRFLYRGIATPAAFIYTSLATGDKIIGREKLPKGEGYFLYMNHTQPIADAFAPSVITFPKRASVIISPKNLDIPALGRALPYLGGVPLPSDMRAARSFSATIGDRIASGEAVAVYPEAHLWPFYTGIRPFGEDVFSYPARLCAPVLTATRVYKKRRSGFRCEIYIDGPFLPDPSVSKKEAARKLCNAARTAMEERAALSDYIGALYLRRDKKGDESK